MNNTSSSLKISVFVIFMFVVSGGYIVFYQENLLGQNFSLATVFASIGKNVEECSDVPLFTSRDDIADDRVALEGSTNTVTAIREEVLSQVNDNVLVQRKRSELQQVLKNRKELLVKRMRSDPEGALYQVLKDDDIEAALVVTRNCVETKKFVEGIFSVIHIDDFEKGTSINSYYLDTNNKKRIILHPAGGVPASISAGSRVKIGGYIIGDEMLFDGGIAIEDLAPNEMGISLAVAQAVVAPLTEKRIAVLTAKFQDQTTPAPSNDSARNLILERMEEFFQEESYSKVTLRGDVFGPITLPINGQQNCGSLLNSQSIINASFQLGDPLVDYSFYSDLIVVVDDSAYCARYFGGYGLMNQTNYPEMQDNYGFALVSLGSSSSVSVAAHELGHVFGSPHDNFSYCKLPLVCSAKNDRSVEYGNQYSTMGYASPKGHFSAADKKLAGFLIGSEILAVTQSGRYDIAPLESQSTLLPRALEIPRYQAPPLYLEYRQPIGRDAIFSSWYPNKSDIFAGALVTSSDGARSNLIDPTPSPAPNAKFSALKIGDVFTDPVNGTKISVVAKDATKLTADIQLGPIGDISVKITSPKLNPIPQFTNPKSITVLANVAVPIGKVKRVTFSIDSRQNVVATDATAPYGKNINVKTLSAGRHSIYVTAWDEFGYSSYSRVRVDIIR
ncbi:MAG: hypothetical protein A3J55_02930 [Candidatus Ryanbacteria bacterium RIFCSPHIGHO2_02_FULL_45_17b]|uniref:Uncharacterized protein n=1 Tax=Candidatus Ryanbacteria bacterium RIFCSPHIGHO2_01_FULL_45_22 TaxID=1802114 RepID=A0A1G2FZD7_9BACT|nr:MAG: hypothetical protein A2719_05530 [Candidatus Ryanbacteria bacterium RIFCSPHIGHO2_01_FULL_45_22]OGZ47363.1 MAG: hypothetical protein A3J55_02930 [Candidatus Ryanbacteria bacterium RIFCSPHIGHO2_02_FULL_45_17b]